MVSVALIGLKKDLSPPRGTSPEGIFLLERIESNIFFLAIREGLSPLAPLSDNKAAILALSVPIFLAKSSIDKSPSALTRLLKTSSFLSAKNSLARVLFQLLSKSLSRASAVPYAAGAVKNFLKKLFFFNHAINSFAYSRGILYLQDPC
jgi:hypothetical protein